MRIQIRQLMFLALLVGRVAAADQSQNIDSESATEPHEVLVLLQTVQEEMLGPDALSNSVWSQIGLLGAFFGPGGEFVGSSMEGVASLARRDSEAKMEEGIQSVARALNFEAAVLGVINELDFDSNWLLYEVLQGDYAVQSGRTANRLFSATPVDFVLFIDTTYYVAPELNQIRLRFEVRMYSPSKIKGRLPATYVRKYEYLSQSRGNILRPFRDGEKEAMIAEIEARFAELVERYPANRKAYSKDRRSALRILNNRDVVLPITAMDEGWPGSSFKDELVRATNQMKQMLRMDLREIQPSKRVEGQYVPFNGLSSSGKPKKFKGYIVEKLSANTVYRDKGGDMYSVP